jgi:hypothetical protein
LEISSSIDLQNGQPKSSNFIFQKIPECQIAVLLRANPCDRGLAIFSEKYSSLITYPKTRTFATFFKGNDEKWALHKIKRDVYTD